MALVIVWITMGKAQDLVLEVVMVPSKVISFLSFVKILDFLEISSLPNIPRQDEGKELIHRAANAVTPLLQRRKLRIIHLTEFYPKNPSLHGLNINHGVMIKIRLRTPERFEISLPCLFLTMRCLCLLHTSSSSSASVSLNSFPLITSLEH
jgi:hypothetical protein